MQQVTNLLPLPNLPIQMHPLVGSGLVKKELISVFRQCETPEQAIAYWRSLHSAERSKYRCLFWMESKGNNAIVRFLLDFEGRQKRLVGKTENDPEAVKILIANWRSGQYLTGIRWELYEDKECENLIDMGRFDQWDLLAGIDKTKLGSLAKKGIAPQGDWDFDKMLWARPCLICGKDVSVNYLIYDIDSVVCAECGNRPFLAPSVHAMLDMAERIGDREMKEQAVMHALGWISGVNSRFDQVRGVLTDAQGLRLKGLWEQTTMAKALGRDHIHVSETIEKNTGFSFAIYKACCEKMHRALTGAEKFDEEHGIAIDFVLRTTELLRLRQLATKAN